jgi:hypothetical protein
MTTRDTPTEAELRAAVRDGLSNHTQEFFNPWLIDGGYGHEELARILDAIMSSERLFSNLEKLFAQAKEAWTAEARIDELNKVVTDSEVGFMADELSGNEVYKQLDNYYVNRLAELRNQPPTVEGEK